MGSRGTLHHPPFLLPNHLDGLRPDLLSESQGHTEQRRHRITNTHINWLKYIACLLSFAGALTVMNEPEFHWPYYPSALLTGDNMTANKATKTGSSKTDSLIAQALCKLFCWLVRISKVAATSDYLNTHDNTFTDDLSPDALANWIHKLQLMSANELFTYVRLPQTPETLTSTLSLRHFQPSLSFCSLAASTWRCRTTRCFLA